MGRAPPFAILTTVVIVRVSVAFVASVQSSLFRRLHGPIGFIWEEEGQEERSRRVGIVRWDREGTVNRAGGEGAATGPSLHVDVGRWAASEGVPYLVRRSAGGLCLPSAV